MSVNLFDSANDGTMHKEELGPGAVVLRGFALPDEKEGYHPFVGRYRLNLTFRKVA